VTLYSDIPQQRAKFSVEARAVEIAEELNGSCTDLADVLEPGEIDDVPLLQAVEAAACQCEVCGWWDEPDEMDGDGVCTDCACDA
jgi:hypothetical protein